MTTIPLIDRSGVIVIPAHIESKSLLDYLDNNLSPSIDIAKSEYRRQIELFNRLKDVLKTDFRCKDVLLNVPLGDGVDAVRKLLNLLRLHHVAIDFEMSDLIIDHYYGTTSSGDIIIPWDFR